MMRYVLRMREDHHRQLAALLRAAMPEESVCFVLCRRAVGAETVVYLADEVIPVDRLDYARQDVDIASVTPMAMARVAQRARELGRVVIMAHIHPMTTAGVSFSRADYLGNRRTFAFMHRRVPQVEHVALVWNADATECAGLIYPVDGDPIALDAAHVVDGVTWRCLTHHAGLEDVQFARQSLLLGSGGQRLLAQVRPLIAGAGGTGSLAAMGLVHHGVRHYTVVDDDLLGLSNLPRVVGAVPGDVDTTAKVAIVARYALAHAHDGNVVQLRQHVEHPSVLPHLVAADMILCCTDNTTSRAHLNQVSQQYLVPLLDVGVQFVCDRDGRVVNEVGRINLARPGTSCLCCTGHIDPARLTAEATPSEERQRPGSYLRGFDDPQPSMMAFNMEVVGRALQVLVGFITGVLQTPLNVYEQRSFLKARGGSLVRRIAKSQREDCSICTEGHIGIGADQPMHMRKRAA